MESIFNFLTHLSHHWVTIAANGIWIGALLTAIAWIMRRYARTVNAATGYIVWWAVLALVIASPFLGSGLSALAPYFTVANNELDAPVLAPAVAMYEDESQANTVAVALTEMPEETPAETPKAFEAELTQVPDSHEQPAAVVGQVDSNSGPSLLSVLIRLLPVSLFALWVCIAAVLVFRIWLAYRRMVAIKRRSIPFNPLRYPRVDGLLRRAALHRKTELHLTDEVGSPVAAGLGHPIILIPHTMIGHLTEHELEAVVVHELAHVLRWDDWTKLAQKTIEAFFFFNPAVRWIGRQLELEREVACDDRVVAQTGEPTEYARCLTRLTELATIPNASLIPGVLTGRKQIFHRFDQLLSGKRRTEIRFCRSRFACAMAAVLLVTVVAVRVAPVVALPADAVSYDEFSQTIGSLAAGILPSSDANKPIENAEFTATGTEPDNPMTEPVRFTRGQKAPMHVMFAAATEVSPKEPGVYFADAEPTASSDADSKASASSGKRVVDWNDKIFSLPITGTIHGTEERGGPVEVWINDAQTMRAAMKGKVRFTSDRQGIRSISRDGYFAIKEEYGAVKKELDVYRDSDGKVTYNYFLDDRPEEYSKDARKLLATVITEMGPEPNISVTPVPDAPGLFTTGPDVVVAPLPPVEGNVVIAVPSVSPAPVALIDPDAPEPRIGKEGFIGRVIDWATNPFNLDGNGLMISSDDDGETSILWSNGRNKIKVKMDGDIVFTDDDRGIESISRRGYFAVWERRGSKTRELTVEPDRDGILEYGYFEDGKSKPFEDDAREWFADILIDVIRNTGVGAEERAARILKKDGVDGVLEEIEAIESNYVKRIYFNAILDHGDLSQNDYSRILQLVGQEIDSDYDKAEILTDMADRVSENSALIHDYVGVVATMDSDYEIRRALSAVTMCNNVDPEVVDAVLEIAAEMDSDYEKAELLIAMAPYCKAHGKLQTSYVNAVVGIGSDYEARRVLSALSLQGNVDPEIVNTVMQIIGQFDSDYEAAELLSGMAPMIGNNDRAQDAYLEAVGKIDSDYDRRRTLTTFIGSGEMTGARVMAILPIVQSMSSSYEQSEVLKALASYCRGSDELEDAFIQVVETLDSDYEIQKLYTHLYRRDRSARGSSR